MHYFHALFSILKNLFLYRILRQLRVFALLRFLLGMIAIGVVQYRWWFRRHPQKKHDLDAPLILSLTSYPARYKTLVYTLRCLLTQTIKPDQVVLWIAYTDQSTIPNEVLGLCGDGLKIHFCEDTKSYKKIIPTLQAYPNCYVITVDDDLFYEAKMVERLINSFQSHKREVICNRGHLITLDITKKPNPYHQWKHDVGFSDVINPRFLLATSGAGVLYPPDVFHHDVCQSQIFQLASPLSDDIWMYWMIRMNGYVYKKISENRFLITWPFSQRESLYARDQESNNNDLAIESLINLYGVPY